MSGKPHFPAKFWHRRMSYPERYCQNAGCGKRLVPRVEKSGHLERVSAFSARNFCDKACAYAHRQVVGTAPRNRTQKVRRPVPPPEDRRSHTDSTTSAEPATREQCLEALKAACELHPELGPMLTGQGTPDTFEPMRQRAVKA